MTMNSPFYIFVPVTTVKDEIIAFAFQAWLDTPVLTTVKTSALPIKEIPFPALTICGQGMNDDIVTSGFMKVFFTYIKTINITMGMSPIKSANSKRKASLVSNFDQ